jgi:hypothetical protein
MSLSTLPTELLHLISSSLSTRSVASLPCVNRALHCHFDSRFWTRRFRVEGRVVANAKDYRQSLTHGVPRVCNRRTGQRVELHPKLDVCDYEHGLAVVAVTIDGEAYLYLHEESLLCGGATDGLIARYFDELCTVLIEDGRLAFFVYNKEPLRTGIVAKRLDYLCWMHHGNDRTVRCLYVGENDDVDVCIFFPWVGTITTSYRWPLTTTSYYWNYFCCASTRNGEATTTYGCKVRGPSCKKWLRLTDRDVFLHDGNAEPQSGTIDFNTDTVKDMCSIDATLVVLYTDGRLVLRHHDDTEVTIDRDVVAMMASSEKSLLAYIKDE